MDRDNVKMALDGGLIEEDMVECRPEKVTNAIIDDNVDIHLVRRYFSNDAWMVLQDLVERKKEQDTWSCKSCCHDLEGQSIICESCLEWFHFHCVGLVQQPKSKNWYCRQCIAACKL